MIFNFKLNLSSGILIEMIKILLTTSTLFLDCRGKMFLEGIIHTNVFPEELGRAVPMYTHSSPGCLGPM